MNDTAASPKIKRRWLQFQLWHIFAGMSLLLIVGGAVKSQMEYRAARAEFYVAIQNNQLDRVKQLLRLNPSLIRSRSPLMRIGKEFSIYSANETPLWIAVNFDSREVFSYLLSLKPDLNGGGEFGPPVIQAALKNDMFYLKMLLQEGADPNLADRQGKTAADYARRYQKSEALQLLSKHTASTGAKP